MSESLLEFNSEDGNMDFLMDSPPSSKHDSDIDEKPKVEIRDNLAQPSDQNSSLETPSLSSSLEMFAKLPPVGETRDVSLPFPVAKSGLRFGVMDNRKEKQLETIVEEETFIPEHPVESSPLTPTKGTQDDTFIPESPLESPPLTGKSKPDQQVTQDENDDSVVKKTEEDNPMQETETDKKVGNEDTGSVGTRTRLLASRRPTRLLLKSDPESPPVVSGIVTDSGQERREVSQKSTPRILDQTEAKPFIPEVPVETSQLVRIEKGSQPLNPVAVENQPFIPAQPVDPIALSPITPRVTWQEKEKSKRAVQLKVEEPVESGTFEVPLIESQEFAKLIASPIIATERALAASLSRAMSGIKWTFGNELSNLMRNYQSPENFDQIDDFISDISISLSEAFEVPALSIEETLPNICNQISTAITDQAKPMTTALLRLESSNSSLRMKMSQEMRQLQQEVEQLRSMLKTNSDAFVKKLEKQVRDMIASREAEAELINDLEAKMKSFQWSRVELETRSKHQKNEQEKIDKLTKAYLQKRDAWRESQPENGYEASGRLRQELLQEIALLKQESNRNIFENLSVALDEGVRIMTDEYNNLQEELTHLDIANSLVMMNMRKSQSLLQTQRPKRSSFAEGQKTEHFRRKRENTIRDMMENLS